MDKFNRTVDKMLEEYDFSDPLTTVEPTIRLLYAFERVQEENIPIEDIYHIAKMTEDMGHDFMHVSNAVIETNAHIYYQTKFKKSVMEVGDDAMATDREKLGQFVKTILPIIAKFRMWVRTSHKGKVVPGKFGT